MIPAPTPRTVHIPPAGTSRVIGRPALLLLGAALLAACSSGSSGTDPIPEGCDPETTPTLAVGETQSFQGGAAALICIRAPSGGGEFVLVPFSNRVPSTSFLTLQVQSEGVQVASGPPTPQLPAPPLLRDPHGGHPRDGLRDAAFDGALRERERRELGPLIRRLAPGDPAPVEFPGMANSAAAELGDLVTLNAQPQTACSDEILRTGRVMAISQRAIVIADTLNPLGGFTPQDYQDFAAAFDTLVVPVMDPHFGVPTDLDGNGRTILFFTEEVNRLTDPDGDSFVGGFFFSRDLFPRTATPRFQACATSNEAELLYLRVPDPDRTPQGLWSRTRVRRDTPSTMAHEQQHLINAARRLHIIQAQEPFEETWLNEGLSHAAEELLFFRASGLQPRSNLGIQELRDAGSRAIDAVNAHHLPNIFRFQRYLEDPDVNSPYDEEDTLEARGAAQQFLRYSVDRRGGNEAPFFRSLVDSQTAGIANLAAALGGSSILQQWLADWGVAIYADSRVPGLRPEHRLPSWNHPSLFAALDVQPYPIRTRSLSPTQSASVRLAGGGATHLRFATPDGEVAQIRFSVNGSPPPPQLRATLLRTR